MPPRQLTAAQLQQKSQREVEDLHLVLRARNGDGSALDALMRDLLQFADPSAGEVAKVDVVHELRTALQLLAEDMGRARIEVRSQLPPEPAPVSIDPVRLRQSLLNVLTFAQHRAGKSGTIHVQVERSGRGVEIAVADSGPQLPEDQRKRLFQPFQGSARKGGTGLGLAIAHELVVAHGGAIRLRDTDKGAAFEIDIPDRDS